MTKFEKYIEEYIKEAIESEMIDEDEDFNSWVEMFVTGRNESYDITNVCNCLEISKRAFTAALRQHQIETGLVKAADMDELAKVFAEHALETQTTGRRAYNSTITTVEQYIKKYAVFTLKGVAYLPANESLL